MSFAFQLTRDWSEVNGSRTLEGDEQQLVGRAVFVCDFADQYLFAQQLLGGFVSNGRGAAYLPPAYYPGFPELVCRGIKMTPYGAPTGGNRQSIAYTACRVEATFKAVDFHHRPQDGQNDNHGGNQSQNPNFVLASESVHTKNEYAILGKDQYVFSSTKKFQKTVQGSPPHIVKQPPGRLSSTMEYVVDQHYVPYLDLETLFDLAGKVNWRRWPNNDDSKFGFSPQTLLYQGLKAKTRTNAYGTRFWEVSHMFLYRPNFGFDVIPWTGNNPRRVKFGWNAVIDPDTGIYDVIEPYVSLPNRDGTVVLCIAGTDGRYYPTRIAADGSGLLAAPTPPWYDVEGLGLEANLEDYEVRADRIVDNTGAFIPSPNLLPGGAQDARTGVPIADPNEPPDDPDGYVRVKRVYDVVDFAKIGIPGT